MYKVEILCGEVWVVACSCETKEGAEFWIREFEKVSMKARIVEPQ